MNVIISSLSRHLYTIHFKYEIRPLCDIRILQIIGHVCPSRSGTILHWVVLLGDDDKAVVSCSPASWRHLCSHGRTKRGELICNAGMSGHE